MAYEILETCMLVPGVGVSECAGWVQAWGSIIGLAVAIGVPMVLHVQEVKAKKAAELAAANITGSAVLLTLGPLVGCIEAILTEIHEYQTGTRTALDLTKFRNLMSIPYPNEWQMLQISPFKPATAIAIARATHLFLQSRTAVQLLVQHNPHDLTAREELIPDLRDGLELSRKQFAIAKAGLEEFFNEREGIDQSSARVSPN